MIGFIYAIESGGFVKIGWSRKPQLRLNKIHDLSSVIQARLLSPSLASSRAILPACEYLAAGAGLSTEHRRRPFSSSG